MPNIYVVEKLNFSDLLNILPLFLLVDFINAVRLNPRLYGRIAS